MISDTNTVARKKCSHARGAVLLLGVFILAGVTSSGRWVRAETTSEPIQICSEIVYQGYVGVRKIVKIDSETLSTQEASHLGVHTLFIEPGSPWENGYVESF